MRTFLKRLCSFKEDMLGTILLDCAYAFTFLALATLPMFTTREGFTTITNVLSILSCVSIIGYLFFRGKIYLNYFVVCMALFILYGSIVTIIGSKEFSHLKSLLTLYALAFCCFQFAVNEKNQHFLFIAISTGLVLLLGRFFIEYRSEIWSLIKNSGTSNRKGDDFGNLNYIGRNFAIGCCLSTFVALKYKRWYLLLLILSLVFLFAVFLTGSRGALVIAVILLLPPLYFLFPKNKRWLFILLVAILALIIFGLIQLPMFSNFKSYFEKAINAFNGEGRENSSRNRLSMLYDAANLWLKNMFFGYGTYAFAGLTSFGTYCHNSLFELLCSFGLIGGSLFYFPIGIMVRNIFRRHRRADNYYLVFSISYFIGILLVGLFFFVLYLDKLLILILMMLMVNDFVLYFDNEKYVSISFFRDRKFAFVIENKLDQTFPKEIKEEKPKEDSKLKELFNRFKNKLSKIWQKITKKHKDEQDVQ